VAGRVPATHVFEEGCVDSREGVDDRDEPGQGDLESRVSANSRLFSTGQPWHKAVRMSPELHRRVAAARSGKSVNTFVAETPERSA
jgi:HicB family